MGIARRHLGMKPELYDPAQAVSEGDRRVDVLLEDAEKTKDPNAKGGLISEQEVRELGRKPT